MAKSKNPESKQFTVPKGLSALIEELACAILLYLPDDIIGFLADYLESKLSGKPLEYKPRVPVPADLPPDGFEAALIEATRKKSIMDAVASFDFSKNCVCEATDELAAKLGSKPAVTYENVKPEEQQQADGRSPKTSLDKGYIPNEAIIEKQRLSIGISKVEVGKGIPPNLTPAKVALFEKVDLAILQGLELVDYLEKAVESYKQNPVKKGKKKHSKPDAETLKNRPSRVEIADHVDVALGNAFKLRDGLDEILREHSGDGPEARKSEMEQRALLKHRQNGSLPPHPTSTMAFLKRKSQADVSEALVIRVDKLNTVVARALELVEELDQMDIPEGDDVQVLMEPASMGEESRPESQSQMQGRGLRGKPAAADLTDSQAALLQKAANDTIGILLGGGQLTPSQIQLLQSRGLLTPSQAQILLAGGKLTPAQLKTLTEKNLADAQAAADIEAATQKVIDFALDVLQNGGSLTPSQVQLLADRNLLTPSKADILANGGVLSPSQIHDIVARKEASDEDKAMYDALDKLHHGYKLTPSEIQLLQDRNFVTPSKAALLARGELVTPSLIKAVEDQAKLDAQAEKDAGQATAKEPLSDEEAAARTQEAILVLQAGGDLTPSQIALLADQDLISASKAQLLVSGGKLTPSQIQVIALDASTGNPDVDLDVDAMLSASQARLQKEQDALELLRNGGHPTHSQIQILAESGQITADEARTLAGGGSILEIGTSPQALALATDSRHEIQEEGFTHRQIRIMRGLLMGKVSVAEAPIQAGIILAIFVLGVAAGYHIIKSAHRRNLSFAETLDEHADGEPLIVKKCDI